MKTVREYLALRQSTWNNSLQRCCKTIRPLLESRGTPHLQQTCGKNCRSKEEQNNQEPWRRHGGSSGGHFTKTSAPTDFSYILYPSSVRVASTVPSQQKGPGSIPSRLVNTMSTFCSIHSICTLQFFLFFRNNHLNFNLQKSLAFHYGSCLLQFVCV